MQLLALPNLFAICRLAPNAPIPSWVTQNNFVSITRTDDELSIVCDQAAAPNDALRGCERDWRCLRVNGPLDFALTGILASLATPLAQASISIFAISTFDTDYLLVKANQFEQAINTLRNAGHQVL